MIEYHIYTDVKQTYEQAFVFVCYRDEKTLKVDVGDMYTITSIHHVGEVHTKVDMRNVFTDIIKNVGGNINKEDCIKVFEIFGQLIPDSLKHQSIEEVTREELKRVDSDMLLRGAEVASGQHATDFDTLIKNLDKKL